MPIATTAAVGSGTSDSDRAIYIILTSFKPPASTLGSPTATRPSTGKSRVSVISLIYTVMGFCFDIDVPSNLTAT
jgi:hypothetical protein